MGNEFVDEKKKSKQIMFDAESATELVRELRVNFCKGTTRSYQWRVSQLKSLLKMINDHEHEIVDSLRRDLDKPETESSIYEVAVLKNSCKVTLKALKKWMKPEKVSTTLPTYPSRGKIVSEPLGVVLIISAWNYPILLSLDPVIGAIAAGNAVVLKPSEIAPASSSLLAKLVPEYFDNSVIRVVEGAVSETSALLEQKWDKIFYTGNGKIGRIVMAAAAKHLTPVVLELGGKSPLIVDSEIHLQTSVRRIIAGKWCCNNGQACISPDYIITTKDNAPKLVDALKKELEKFYGKNPLESKYLSRIVNSNHFARLSKLLDDDKVSGKIIHGGERDETKLRIAPTLLLEVPLESLIMKEEIFGPLLPIITVDKIEESFGIINSGMKPLAAYLFTNNNRLKKQFVMTISAGGLVINDTTLHLAVHTLPFGGVGESGMGGYHGKFSFDAFSHKKAVLYRSFFGDAPLRYPPYTKSKLNLLKAFMAGSIRAIIRALIGLFNRGGVSKLCSRVHL